MASHCFPFPSLLLLLLFLLTPSFTVAQATSPNITLRKSLTARSSDSFWSSASGDFAFGFRQAVGGDYLLAIWFNKIDEKTVVWSANRDKLAPGGSTVVLTTSGQLILNNPAGKQIWSSTSTAPNKSVSSAVLLDNGNFILAANDSEIVWQSFDDPTDTILPSQILKKGNKLVASYSETNYSSGRFEFYMQTDGNLLLYIRNFPYDAISNYYWSTDTVNFGFQVVFNLSGSIVLIDENKAILNTLSSNNPTAQSFYQRAILEHDGVFRHYIYPRGGTGRNSSWPKAWSISKSIPSNICMTIGQSSDGGVCGFNSYCKLGDDQKPFCSCPEGYVLFDPNDVTQSCKPNFVPQSCAFPELDDFDFVSLDNSDWPQSDYGDYGHNIPVNEDWCRNECLNDCFCVAATFRDGNCWKKKFPLSFGRMDYSVGGKALIKVRRRNSTLQSRNLDKNCNNETKIIIGSILLGSLFLNILLLLLTLLIGCRFSKRKLKFNGGDPFILGVNLRAFSYEELNKATKEFRDQLGSGAFATVYKGTLGSVDDNNLVAVKKLENIVSEGSGENEFKAEVRYVAPEWFRSLPITVKVDVYSFGIMLLEMICCRKNFEMETEDEDERILSDWAYDCMNEGKMEKLIREDEEGRSDMKRVERFVKIGIWCIQEDPSLRPSMKKVIQMLEVVRRSKSLKSDVGKRKLSSSLIASPRNHTNHSYWSSPSGDFAFGFLDTGTNGFLLAIWFNKIPENTIVWSANPNHLVPSGSILQLTTHGQLVLNDSAANQIWAANFQTENTTVSHAAMLDTGNFILAAANNNSQVVLWQSFDEPTDTILPSQVMKPDTILIARFSKTNYSDGRFHLRMESDGNLVLYTRIVPLGSQGNPYWSSNTVGSGFNLVFDLSGSIYVSAKNGTALTYLTSKNPSSNQHNFYHRAIFEYDGVFRQYIYSKSDEAWKSVSDFIPLNICASINNGLGSGVCGYNSYCVTGEDQRPICKCPQGYYMVDPNDEMQGCRPSFIPQICSLAEANSFDFFSIERSDWTDSDYEGYSGTNEDWCRRACLDDCFCAAVVFETGNCWKKKFPLSFGRVNPDFRGKALIKIRRDNSTLIDDNLVKRGKDKTLLIIGLVLLGSSGFLIFISLLAVLIVYRIKKKRSEGVMGKVAASIGVNVRAFSYEELNKATNGFTEKLGSGAFATVYKGILDDDDCLDKDNKLVAVKKLEIEVKEGEQEFKAEVSAIARTNHKNLVRLLGFCNEHLHRLIVYEFMPNGCLADFLFGPSQLNWYERIQLARETARGLCYLHEECKTQIIHCDIKPQNILLDESLRARISDFGLAKLLKENQTRTTTAIRGTKGYVAPEWFRSNLPITVKVDVYSFGIVLLEIISCRRSFELEVEDENEMVLADWAYDCFKERRVDMLVRKDDDEAKGDMKTVEKLVMIAIWCIQEEPSLRPSMKKVLQMLEGVVEVSIPPDPSSFISTIQ
ncbi:hypothetical protein Csa_017988 [Cucumis sativus]|nr:hypothetical protein Csa_017988 [Cucumis sativus]